MRRPPRLPPEELAPYLLPSPDPPVALDGPAVFGNDHPVELEVGFGKGLFLVTSAQAHPDVNYLGVEIVRKYQFFTATRLAKRGLGNVRVAHGDARAFLRDRLAPGSLRTVHLFFPDPWWKKRHRKRRVFTAEFAGHCERALRPGGMLNVVTDVEEYFQLILETVTGQTALRPLPTAEPDAPRHDLDFLTNFERKFRKEGRPIYRARFERLPTDVPPAPFTAAG